ncbi:MAG: ribonuclease P protein component [Candidatus Saelkia tenebricola]|nr:ribonuclease P protein component [Candidatus Saelkia tenebricola]
MQSEDNVKISSLKLEKDINNVFSKGSKIGNRFCVLYYQAGTQPNLRLGVFVPKKVFKKAVDRNRAKRIIREVFRQEKSDLGGLDIICLLTKCQKGEVSLKLFSQHISALLQKVPSVL